MGEMVAELVVTIRGLKEIVDRLEKDFKEEFNHIGMPIREKDLIGTEHLLRLVKDERPEFYDAWRIDYP